MTMTCDSCGYPIDVELCLSKFKQGVFCSKKCVDSIDNAGVIIY